MLFMLLCQELNHNDVTQKRDACVVWCAGKNEQCSTRRRSGTSSCNPEDRP